MKKSKLINLLLEKYEKRLRELSYNELLDNALNAYQIELELSDKEKLELQALLQLNLDIEVKE